MRISDWSSDVCSSDLVRAVAVLLGPDPVGVQQPLGDIGHMRGERIGRLRVGDDGVGTPAGHAEDRRRQPRIARPVRQFPLRAIGEGRSEEHTSELQSLMRSSYAVFCLKKQRKKTKSHPLDTATFTYLHTCSIIR